MSYLDWLVTMAGSAILWLLVEGLRWYIGVVSEGSL